MDNIQEQDSELLSSDQPTTPKWLSIVFKLYGAFALITTAFSIVVALISDKSELQVSLVAIFLIALGGALMSFILAYGCWKLKRWVIPILGFLAVSGFILLFRDSTVQIISSSIIVIIIFVIAIYYRKYFSGPYRPRYMHGLYLFGILLTIVPIIFPLFIDDNSRGSYSSAYTLSDIKTYNAGLELYYNDNNQYPKNLEVLETVGYVLPQSISYIYKNPDEKVDYCITDDKKNYAIGSSILDYFGNIIEDSASQSNLPCNLNFDKVCRENGYYCEVGLIPTELKELKSATLPLSSSTSFVTADIKEIGMTFEYPSWWGDSEYVISPGFGENSGIGLYLWFSNYDKIALGGLSVDYYYPRQGTMFDFQGYGGDKTSFDSSYCNAYAVSERTEELAFHYLLNCEEINVDNDIRALDYFLTANWTDEPNREFRPALYRIVEFNVPYIREIEDMYIESGLGGLRLIFNLDEPTKSIEKLQLTVEKPESLIENKEKMLEFYEDIVYGLQLEVADDNLLRLNNEFTDLVSSIKFQ